MMQATAAHNLRGEIESPRPLHASGGKVEIRGWCSEGDHGAPPVRLLTPVAILPATERVTRPDFRGAPCGFIIRGSLPPGVHLAEFQALTAERGWTTFRSYTLRVEAPPLAAAIEWPVSTGTITERVRIAGWAVHHSQRILSITLRFGHQDIACDFGGTREDVAALFPSNPEARRCGFITSEKLPAGHGPLRVRAQLADGTTAVVETPVKISVPSDENLPASLNLQATRVPLPGYDPGRPAAPATPTSRPLNILFILPGNFAANNALHAVALANELAASGHQIAIAVSRDVETANQHLGARFTPLAHASVRSFSFSDRRGPDVVHAWTTRETVRALAESLRAQHRCTLVVHLEDNEQHLLAQAVGRSFAELDALPDAELDSLVPPTLSHPHRARSFLASADGITLITARLREFAPVAARCLTFWPAADDRYFYPRAQPAEFRRLIDLHPDETVLFYHGNVHAANAGEVRELYTAIARLNESGVPVTLIRAGSDEVDFLETQAVRARSHVLELGPIAPHRHIPALMALADMFVQPGVSDAFNDYRLPSKLPEFFSIGRPVVLPRTNVGENVRHGMDAYVLERADATGIAHAVREIRADPALATRLAEGALKFSAEHFSWRRSAESLAKFYAALAPS